MANTLSISLLRVLTVAASLLIVKVTIEVMCGYVNYFPPNFGSDFLRGRDRYFFGAYQWAFYAHIASGPAALLLGMVLLSESFRRRSLRWHRILGRFQTVNILCVMTPSGLWMAYYAAPGTVSAISFAVLAVLTGVGCALGWRAAVSRKIAVHRRWMWRTFLLMCSAVTLRLLGGLGTLLEVQSDWFDPLASWASWLLPLAVFELSRLKMRSKSQSLTQPAMIPPTH